MKIRTDFVTNSSSSSFVTLKIKSPELEKLLNENNLTRYRRFLGHITISDSREGGSFYISPDNESVASVMGEYFSDYEGEEKAAEIEKLILDSGVLENADVIVETGYGGGDYCNSDDFGFSTSGESFRYSNGNLFYYAVHPYLGGFGYEGEESCHFIGSNYSTKIRDMDTGYEANNVVWDNEKVQEALTYFSKAEYLSEFACKEVTELSIPEQYKSIDEKAFSKAKKLKKIILNSDLKAEFFLNSAANLETIEVSEKCTKYSTVDGVLFSKDMKQILRFPRGRKGVYEIPSGVENIAESAFEKCGKLTGIVIPESVTSIEKDAFSNCKKLETAEVKGNLLSIGKNAFKNCISLKKIPDKGGKYIENAPEENSPSGNNLSGLAFVVTGTMSSMTRSEIEKVIVDNGGTVSSSVGKKTNVLIAGEKAGSKLAKAQAMGIEIWSEQDFINKIKK